MHDVFIEKVMIFSQGWRGGNCQQWKEQVRFNKRQKEQYMDLRSKNLHLLDTKVTELRNASSSKNLQLLDTTASPVTLMHAPIVLPRKVETQIP